ncbi:hypothetical protein NUU61_008199 [Penicillium alfredii]|uniref:NGG1 interacting factor Nif3 n=1 Tax=Penicillium alfredii TaxID=1506179 RepID=A0A9W9ES00_9EURO|nr:uncharacterized protein NUU61_008199 [Penicillium alfredii]KAJ5086892.1 hypothetical protein NUU61_008199 [Penicillium alfredii]
MLAHYKLIGCGWGARVWRPPSSWLICCTNAFPRSFSREVWGIKEKSVCFSGSCSMNCLRSVRHYTMSSISAPVSCSPFTKAVVSSMRKLQKNSVLLTIDLTTAVADEAIRRRDSVVVAYHPIIFRGLKAITLDDTQQRSLLRLAQHGISVYSPHTAVDTVPGGMADWLCDVVTGSFKSTSATPQRPIPESASKLYSEPTYPHPETAATTTTTSTSTSTSTPTTPHTRSTIHPSPLSSIPAGLETAGAGRLVTFSEPQPLPTLIDHIAQGVGLPGGIPIAIPQSASSINDLRIRTVSMCPGSGAGVLLRAPGPLPDLLFTGEMSHHEALAATERGSVVISLAHSNSERGYLRAVMRARLAEDVEDCWRRDREDALGALRDSAKQGGAAIASASASGELDVYSDGEVEVAVSKADRDPYGIMVWRG